MSKTNQNLSALTKWAQQEGFTLEDGVMYDGRWPVSLGTFSRAGKEGLPPYTAWQAAKANRLNSAKWQGLNSLVGSTKKKTEASFCLEASGAGF